MSASDPGCLCNCHSAVMRAGFPDLKEHATCAECKLALAIEAKEFAEAELKQAKDSLARLDWQNQPNRNPAARGAYEFYINEEWKGIAREAIDSDADGIATLRKHRLDADDERVRVRRAVDDDALLSDLARVTKERDEILAMLREVTFRGNFGPNDYELELRACEMIRVLDPDKKGGGA